MATSIQSIVNEVLKVLRDESANIVGAFSVEDEVLPYINDSLSDIVTDCPMANPVTAAFATAATTLQTLDASAVALIDVRRNLGADGETVGKVITKVPEDALDAGRPTWPTDVCGDAGVPTTPTHYISSIKSPRRFYLWPTPPDPWYVETIAATVPADVTIDDDYPLPDMFISTTKAYVISHILARRDREVLDPQKHAQVAALITFWNSEYTTSLKASVASMLATVPRDAKVA